MIFDNKKENIYCPICQKWIDKLAGTLILETIVYCIFCYNEEKNIKSYLGYIWDLTPCQYLFEGNWCLKQNKMIDCNGKEEGCKFLGEEE